MSESRTLVKRDTKDDLSKSVEQLRETVKKELDKLKAEGKLALAAGLEKADKLVEEVEGQLKKLNPTTEVGKALLATLEATLEKAKAKVEEEIKKLSGSFYAEVDFSAIVLKQVGQIYDQAKSAIETLAKSGKKELVNGLEKTIAFIKSVDEKVKTLKPTTESGKFIVQLVEKLVKTGVDILEADLKKAQGTYFETDANKEALLKAVSAVLDEADKIKKEDKKELAVTLPKVIALVKQIQTDFKTLHPTTPVGKAIFDGVSNLVNEIEVYLEAELKSVSGTFYDETVKDELKTQIDNLKKQAQEAIAKLLGQGKTVLAEEVKKLETHLVDLEAQLEKLNPTTEVGKTLLKALETLVKGAETKLEEEIKKLSGSFYADVDIKDLARKQIEQIYDQLQSAVETLAKTNSMGKKQMTNGLDQAITIIKSADEKLKVLKPTTEGGKLFVQLDEQLLKIVVDILEADLKKLRGTYFEADANKEALLKVVSAVLDEAEKVIKNTKTEDKKALVEGLTKVVAIFKEIQPQFKTIEATTPLTKSFFDAISNLISEGEVFLEGVLKSISGVFYDETVKDELKTQLDNLKKQAQEAIAKLLGQGKTVLAEEVKKLETHLVDLEAQLEKLNPTTEVGKALLKGLEALVKAAETKLEEEIKKLSGSFYDDTQDELKKQIDNLKKQAQDAIEKLKAQGKTALAEGIKKLESQLVDLESQLEKLNPTTEIGKTLLKSLETLVKGAETKLEEEIKKLTGTF